MAKVLHLLKSAPSPLADAAIRRQLDAGDRIEAALLEGAPALQLPDGVAVHRVPDDLSYDDLLEKIFDADQVIAW